ncbi:hypothetical protein [Mangrovimonas aestuarii]|uniref:hypothetical protein n=1 Tax=Mangrovimonas aestuarii TaxID=3018443 RepID=UPI0023792B58|nr:hypothetical protein [Mangrovimonas aestuarii]
MKWFFISLLLFVLGIILLPMQILPDKSIPQKKWTYPPQQQFDTIIFPDFETPEQPPPSYLMPTKDVLTGYRLFRVADTAIFNVKSQQLSHHYSSTQAWNADLTLIMLQGYGAAILNAEDYSLLKWADVPYQARWSRLHPNRIYGVFNKTDFGYLNVATEEVTILHGWKGYAQLELGFGEGNLSDNDSLVCLAAETVNGYDLFVYNIEKDKIEGSMVIPKNKRHDWVSVSPSGNYVLLSWKDDGCEKYQGLKRYNIDFSNEKHLSDYTEHSDMGYDAYRDEVYVSWTSPEDNYQKNYYYLKKIRLSDGKTTGLLYDPPPEPKGVYGGHISLRSYLRPGWAYVSEGCCPENQVASAELFAVMLNDGSSNLVERYGKHFTNDTLGYYHEARASVDPTGTKLIFNSNWYYKPFESLPAAPAWVLEVPQD